MANPTVTIVGIDPGTHITGVAVVEADTHRVIRVLGTAAAVAAVKRKDDPITERDLRIVETGQMLAEWLAQFPVCVAIGCETPYFSAEHSVNNTATLYLLRSCGHYMALPVFGEAERYDIAIQAAKSVCGAAGKKRDDAKAICMAWARLAWGRPITEDAAGEAEADALSIAIATHRKWAECRRLQSQGSLFATSGAKASGGKRCSVKGRG